MQAGDFSVRFKQCFLGGSKGVVVLRASPNADLVAWLNSQSGTALFTTSVTVMDLRFGVARLPEGRCKAGL